MRPGPADLSGVLPPAPAPASRPAPLHCFNRLRCGDTGRVGALNAASHAFPRLPVQPPCSAASFPRRCQLPRAGATLKALKKGLDGLWYQPGDHVKPEMLPALTGFTGIALKLDNVGLVSRHISSFTFCCMHWAACMPGSTILLMTVVLHILSFASALVDKISDSWAVFHWRHISPPARSPTCPLAHLPARLPVYLLACLFQLATRTRTWYVTPGECRSTLPLP